MIPSAIVLAGGLGTRLRSLTDDRYPKPMIPVPFQGREYPFLEYSLAHLHASGIRDIVLCIGHKGEVIENHFGCGDRFGLNIRYTDDGAALTATRVLHACRDYSALEHIILCGDVYQAVDFKAFMGEFHRHPEWLMQLAVTDDSRLAADNVAYDHQGNVSDYDREGVTGIFTGLETGTLCISDRALDYFNENRDLDIAPDIYQALIRDDRLGAFCTRTPFYDIGTPEGFTRFCRFVDEGGAVPLSHRSS